MQPARQERRLEVPPCPVRKEQYMRLTSNSGVTPRKQGPMRQLVAAGVLVAMYLSMPKPARGGRLGRDIMALFPKEDGGFAYADLKKARSLNWFPHLQE